MTDLDKALWQAIENNDIKKVKDLINNGANVNAVNEVGNTILENIALLSSIGLYCPKNEIVKTLIEAGADIKTKKVRGRKAINYPKKSDIKNLIQNAKPDPVKVILNHVKNKHNQRG